MTRVCVVGSVNLDQSFSVATLPGPGETVLASGLAAAPGGKGGNQAIAAARAGAAVGLVAALGDDSAATLLRDHLRANGVDVDAVLTVPGPSGAAAIVVDSHAENTIVVAPGANAHLSMASAATRRVVEASDVVLLQLEVPVDTVLAAARIGRAAGAVVMLNASPAGADPAALAELAKVSDVVVVNESEADEWRWPVTHLVTTRGSRGATHVGADGRKLVVPAPAVDAIDTTGAGDVFAGVLAADWPGGPEYAVRRACAAGALATLVRGAGDCAPTREAIDDVVGDDR